VWTSGSGRFAAFRRASRAGAAGNESIGQITSVYILEYTLIYLQQTSIYTVHDGIYLYILSWNIIYRDIQSYTGEGLDGDPGGPDLTLDDLVDISAPGSLFASCRTDPSSKDVTRANVALPIRLKDVKQMDDI
jgi:hypothetical protein